MLEIFTGFIIHLIQTSNYIGIFILMFLNSAAIPIPSEITLPFAGFLANQGNLKFSLVVIAAVIGDLAGSVIAYSIGYFLEENLVISQVKKYGKFILLTEEDFLKAIKWLQRYGAIVVFLGKITPGVKSFISLAAGLSEIKFSKFITSLVLGSIVYVTAVSYFGYYLGKNWSVLGVYFRKFELFIAILIILGLLWYINRKLKIVKFKR